MSRFDILRAWKDADRQSTNVGESPVGAVELTEAEAATIDGKLAVAICSGCHGCTKTPLLAYQAVINPVPMLRF